MRTAAIIDRRAALVLVQLALLLDIGGGLGTSGGLRRVEARSCLLSLCGVGRREGILLLLILHVEVDKDTVAEIAL